MTPASEPLLAEAPRQPGPPRSLHTAGASGRGWSPALGSETPRWRRPPLFSRKEGSYSSSPQPHQDGGGGTRPPSGSQAVPSHQLGDTHSRTVCLQAGRTRAQCWPHSTHQKGDLWGPKMTTPVPGQQKKQPEERSLAPCHLSKVSDTLVNFLKMCHLMKDKNQARRPAGSTLGLPGSAQRKPPSALTPITARAAGRRAFRGQPAGWNKPRPQLRSRPAAERFQPESQCCYPSWRRCWTPGSAGRKGLAGSGRAGWPSSLAPCPLRPQ